MTVTSPQEDIDTLRETWKTLYSKTLPSLAKAKDASQQKWPITLDHCFARIILDNTVGKTANANDQDNSNGQETGVVPWDTIISRPAVRNMDATQLRAAIDLGERIRAGDVDLVDLDRRSLVGRGKSEGKYGARGDGDGDSKKKRTRDDEVEIKSKNGKGKNAGKKQAVLQFGVTVRDDQRQDDQDSSKVARLEKDLDVTSSLSREEVVKTLQRIQREKGLTPFRRRLYTSLLSVPKGQYTTYAAMAHHLDSIARAVGNGMRNNPFAPDVPCHRVLASDGSIGGFGGDWGRDGKLTEKQNKKTDLLKEEGVKFDSTGKVRGPPWKDFWDLEDFIKEYGEVE